MRTAWFLVLTAAACTFQVDGVPVDAGVGLDPAAIDLAAVDSAAFDLAGVDLSSSDLVTVDLSSPDLTTVDLLPPPADMTTVLAISHVAQHFLTDGTCDLTVASAIDTSNLTIDGAAPPARCVFMTAQET